MMEYCGNKIKVSAIFHLKFRSKKEFTILPVAK